MLSACKTAEVAVAPAVQESKPAPMWVSDRPNNGFKYVGIGFADKKQGSNFQMEAKKNALYDLASEIKVNISSNSVLYTVQNSNNFNESFNSLIKLSNTDNIEGYDLIDSYENDKQYWVYYSLDKQTYADQKVKKKQQIILKASHLIDLAFQDEKNGDFSASLKKRIQAFSVLSPYLNEEITFEASLTHGIATVFDLTGTIQQQLQSISVSTKNESYDLKPYQPSYNALTYRLILKNKSPLMNFPLLIESDNEKVKVQDKAATNAQGDIQIKVMEVEPINQYMSFSLNPDLENLLGNDSISAASISLLKQFIQTSSLKLQAKVSNLN
ncbi:MAG: LPP20 family lipoprotein, partial [Bacteroidota bacterium]